MKKTAIITGASGNLGQAVVKKFLDEAYQVIGTVSPGSTKDFMKHNRLEVYQVDLSNETESEKFAKAVVEKHGQISAALFLAGGFAMGGIADTGEKKIQKMINLNFMTAYHTVRNIFQQMLKQEYGRIIFVGSRPAIEAESGKSVLPYALSKSLLFKLSDLLNAEGSQKNVVSIVVAPSIIDTPQNRAGMPDADFSHWVKVEEIADIMFFSCSDAGNALRDPVFKIFGGA